MSEATTEEAVVSKKAHVIGEVARKKNWSSEPNRLR